VPDEAIREESRIFVTPEHALAQVKRSKPHVEIWSIGSSCSQEPRNKAVVRVESGKKTRKCHGRNAYDRE